MRFVEGKLIDGFDFDGVPPNGIHTLEEYETIMGGKSILGQDTTYHAR